MAFPSRRLLPLALALPACCGPGHLDSPDMLPPQGVFALASALDHPLGIAVDGDFVYFTTFSANGTISRVPIGGGSVEVLANGQDHPHDLAIDGAHLYWTNYTAHRNAGAVMKLRRSGGAPTALVAGVNAEGLAIDERAVYWASPNDGTVSSVPIEGGAPKLLYPGPGAPVVVRVDGGQVYFTSHMLPGMPDRGALLAVPREGGAPRTLASDQSTPIGIAAAAGRVFWATFHLGAAGMGEVRSVPAGGGPSTVLAGGLGGPNYLVSDGASLYVTTYTDGEVLEIPLAGGEPRKIATAQNHPGLLALSATRVYWTTLDGGTVMSAPR